MCSLASPKPTFPSAAETSHTSPPAHCTPGTPDVPGTALPQQADIERGLTQEDVRVSDGACEAALILWLDANAELQRTQELLALREEELQKLREQQRCSEEGRMGVHMRHGG